MSKIHKRVPTMCKGLRLVSITKSNLQSSQQRVSEDLIHWLRQVWWTKIRLPVQRHGIINGHSSSPSQWQILHTHTGNKQTVHTHKSRLEPFVWIHCIFRGFFCILDQEFPFLTPLTCRPPSQSPPCTAIVCLRSSRSVSVVWAPTCPHSPTPSPGSSRR